VSLLIAPELEDPREMTVPIHQTKSDVALQFIRERILSGQFEAGMQLRAEALAEDLGMSATPIREALRLLQADHLVDHRPHHGIVVAGVSPAQAEEIYMVRALLEAPATELATPVVRERALDKLEAIHAKLVAQASRPGDRAEIGSLNADWHWTIYRLCGADYLAKLIEGLWDRFPWRTMWARPEDLERSIREHEGIMAAIRAGEAAEAGRLMRAHILSGRDYLLAPQGAGGSPVPGSHDTPKSRAG
jgi:DNA-binding GntR family transcriptional regulator